MMRRRGQTATRNRRREQSRPWLRNRLQTLRRFGPTALVLLGLVGAVLVLRLSLDKPVERVAISGRFQRVQPLEVEKSVRGAVANQGMVSVDLAQIAHAVEQIPWVDRASVARNWPRALTVQVVEQAPVARWGEGGLVNLRGEVFVHDSRHMPPELAELVGPDGQQGLMTERYLAAAPRLTEAGMRLTRVTLDARGAWELMLDNGVTLRLGREHVDERFERFMRAASRIVATRAIEIAYVDLRYANGFAVGWRASSEGAGRG